MAIAIYFGFLVRHISYAAGGADSSGYLNEGRLLARGTPRVRVALLDTLNVDPSMTIAFVPLGFRPSSGGTMVPTYPPGLPAIFAITGAPFLIGPIAAIACVVLMYATARELSIPPSLACAGAAMLAVSPPFVLIAIQPVSDVVATLFAILAMWSALRASRQPWMAIVSGLVFAAGIAVRPTNAFIAIALVFALRARRALLLRAAAGAAPVAIALAWFNASLYGNPLLTGYGIYDVHPFREVVAAYGAFLGWCALLTALVIPGGLAVVVDPYVDRSHRAMLATWFLPFLLFYPLFGIDGWWFIRYLLPGIPATILGALFILRDARLRPIAVAVLLLLMIAIPFRFMRKYHVTSVAKEQRIFPDTVGYVERNIPHDAIVIASELSGSFFYYAERFTVRPEFLDDARLQTLRSRSSRSWYAAPIDDAEWKRMNLHGHWTRVGSCRQASLWRLD